jgi:Methyltransferase domain
MGTEIIHADLPSRHFEPRIYGVGAWTSHLHFAYDLVAALKPRVLVELGVDRGESYFAFCQSAAENKMGTRCFGVDTWRGDQHAGGYDETTFAQVSVHNRANYETFSTLIRASFDAAREKFEPESIDLLHIDGLHTETAVRHDVDSWLPKVRPGGVMLLHDVDVHRRDFGVWKIWAELQERGRSWTFHDGPGLGVWQKPPALELPGFLEQLLAPPNEWNDALAKYYSERADELQRKIGEHWRDGTIRHTPFAQQTIIQVFYTEDGAHREEDSVFARVGHEGWKKVRIELPPGAAASPLRIDFVTALTTIDVTSIRLAKAGSTYFSASEETGFDSIALSGDVERLAHPTALRLKITGVDPQLYLPVLALPSSEEPLVLQMRLQVSAMTASLQ